MQMTVGELEAALFAAFPREDAEGWDQPGLSVGDRNAVVERVAFDLDQGSDAVLAAAAAGCNVLVTHHPPFIKGGPVEFGPATQGGVTGPGRAIYEAARLGVSVIAMHTNADRSPATRRAYARLLGYPCVGNFEHLQDPGRDVRGSGYGALFEPQEGTTLASVADTCLVAFGGSPRVWGDPQRPVHRLALLNGSWGEPELYGVCMDAGIDCVVVGETRYHSAVDARPHLSVIDLGHDRSELPIVGVLRQAVIDAGVEQERTVLLDCSRGNWWTPERKG